MKHFAANYVFDGKSFVRNSCLSFDDEGTLVCVGEENSGIVEHERMIFFNGILCPWFDVAHLNLNLPLRISLESLNLSFSKCGKLPIVLIENVDLQALEFTNNTIAEEIS